MARYPYSPELKTPGKWTSIDFSNPKLAPAIRILKQQIREHSSSFLFSVNCHYQKEQVRVWDGETIDCYVFGPDGAGGSLPAMLYCHGGGFFLPIQPMMLSLAAQFARELQIKVYLPEYRILPQYPSPYPFRDCQSILQWMQDRGDTAYLLYGESAGGALAAGLALYTRDRGGIPAKGQCLVYPVLDNRCSRYPSMRLYSEAAWPLKNNLAMWREYLKNGFDGLEGCLIPMRAEDVSNLPPAYIEPQQIDTLRDEAVAYTDRLRNAGVEVTLNTVEGGYHGFDADTENEFVQRIVHQRIDAMRAMLVK